jgi:hypothetical protein
MNQRDNFRIAYRDRQGVPGEQVITVSPARDARFENGGFYAMGGSWGCGKVAGTIEGAARLLLQDMATMVWIEATHELSV